MFSHFSRTMCVSARSYYFDIWSRYSANDVAKYNHVLSTHSDRIAGAGQFAHPQLFIVRKCRDLMLVVIVHYVFRALSAIIGGTTGVIFQNTRCITALTCHSAYQTRSLNWFNCHFCTHGRNLLLFANIQWNQCNYYYFFLLSRVSHICPIFRTRFQSSCTWIIETLSRWDPNHLHLS